ncbi:MAG TPA: hypothetical protein VL381_07255 [Rhodocyclaceae bacterium]|jgi:hypothetical protein|nr:hypothetical protein [Rhodocyclaceae bacterium]
MRSRILNIEIAVKPDAVYSAVRDPAKLPLWASGIAKSVEVRDGIWFVETGTALGTVQLTFCADNPFGVLDHTVRLPDGTEVLNPVRVIANGEGSELIFTVFQTAGMSDEQFVNDVQAVKRDLKTIKHLLES